jgi:plastocyanin
VSWLALAAVVVTSLLPGTSVVAGDPGKPAPHRAKAHHHKTTKHHRKKHTKKPKPKVTKPVAPPATTPAPTTPAPAAPAPVATTTTPAAPDPSTPDPAATTPTATTPAPVLPSRAGVDLKEYSVTPTYYALAAGAVQFTAKNVGMDDHDLTVSRDGVQYGQLAVPPSTSGTLRLTLPPGTYTLYCSLYDHAQLGMHATVTVQ